MQFATASVEPGEAQPTAEALGVIDLSSTHSPEGVTHLQAFWGSKKILYLVMRLWRRLHKILSIPTSNTERSRNYKPFEIAPFDGRHMNRAGRSQADRLSAICLRAPNINFCLCREPGENEKNRGFCTRSRNSFAAIEISRKVFI